MDNTEHLKNLDSRVSELELQMGRLIKLSEHIHLHDASEGLKLHKPYDRVFPEELINMCIYPEDALAYIVDHAKECEQGVFNMVHDGYMVVAVPYNMDAVTPGDAGTEAIHKIRDAINDSVDDDDESPIVVEKIHGPVKRYTVDLTARRHCGGCGVPINYLDDTQICDRCQLHNKVDKYGVKKDETKDEQG